MSDEKRDRDLEVWNIEAAWIVWATGPREMKKTNAIILEQKSFEQKLPASVVGRMSPFKSTDPTFEIDWLEEARLSFYGITKLSVRISSHKTH